MLCRCVVWIRVQGSKDSNFLSLSQTYTHTQSTNACTSYNFVIQIIILGTMEWTWITFFQKKKNLEKESDQKTHCNTFNSVFLSYNDVFFFAAIKHLFFMFMSHLFLENGTFQQKKQRENFIFYSTLGYYIWLYIYKI